MCGILGRATTGILPTDLAWLHSGLLTIKHRGPDDVGTWFAKDGKVQFGHRRLSIIETSDLGSQPMVKDEYGLSIIFNGEIYNHEAIRQKLEAKGYVFRSLSDTEVILAAYDYWGSSFVKHLTGMFAIAIYDSQKSKLFLFRDRAGEKPLFYRLEGKNIYFASELKALIVNFAEDKIINKDALGSYLYLGFVPGEGCILDGVNKLTAGGSLIFDTIDGSIVIETYWDIPNVTKVGPIDLKKSKNKFDKLFKIAIKNQLIADVPVGVLLSGGLDSSLVAAVASQIRPGIKTFNASFPGQGSLDESNYAKKISNVYGTEHVELEVREPSPDLLIKLAAQFDEPIFDSSLIPTFLIASEVRKHCKVVLGGDGADELFGGYSHYQSLLKLKKYISYFPEDLLSRASNGILAFLPFGSRYATRVDSLKFDFGMDAPLAASYFNEKEQCSLLRCNLSTGNLAQQDYQKRTSFAGDFVSRLLKADFKNYLAEDILVKVDRATMLASLECRSPFLDTEIINFAFSDLSSKLKVTQANKKIFLKEYAKDILPKDFAFNRKQGFSVPINSWLRRGDMADFFYDTLRSENDFFNRNALEKLIKGGRNGQISGEKIFGIVMFLLWARVYKITAGNN